MPVPASVNDALAAVSAALAAAGTLQDAPPSALAPVLSSVDAVLAAIDSETATIEAAIDQTSLGGVVTEVPAPALAAALLVQADAVTTLSALVTARGYLGRIDANIRNAPG